LIDAEGQVIGINTSGLGHGNSVAIPIDYAKQVADSLEKHGSIKRGYLGVRSQMVDLPQNASIEREQKVGLLVIGAEDDSPAAEAGLMAGDIIIGFNGQKVENHDELFAAMSGDVVGKESDVELLRGGKPETVAVTLVERQEAPHHHRQQGGRGRGRMRGGMGGKGMGRGGMQGKGKARGGMQGRGKARDGGQRQQGNRRHQ
jgi:S1-C subfamily serine protease